jgi:hypothetical protein
MAKRLSPPEQLARSVAAGAVTLVLGAGVSMSRGVPMWAELTARMWRDIMRTPFRNGWDRHLPRLRELAAGGLGDDVGRAAGFPGHPFELPFAFELMFDALAARDADGAAFARLLRAAIYEHTGDGRAQTHDTLATLATILRREQARPDRRVSRVITFNVDDLLEREVHGDRLWKSAPIVWPLSRESHSPRRARRPPIPVYHLHGFLPRWPGTYPHAPDTLVFTDAQYWKTVAQPSSFANRVVAHALHDSACIFVGISMSDMNLIRWLGLRANAVADDRATQYPGDPDKVRRATRAALQRHFWIRPDADDRSGLVTPLLERRGVTSVPIDSWSSPEFRRLLFGAFAV